MWIEDNELWHRFKSQYVHWELASMWLLDNRGSPWLLPPHWTLSKTGCTLSQNTRKWAWNAKNKKCIARYFAPLFSHSFFRFSHFALGSAFVRKLNGFYDFIFRSINKTQNSSEMRKVYIECFAFRGVSRMFSQNTCEMWNTKSV